MRRHVAAVPAAVLAVALAGACADTPPGRAATVPAANTPGVCEEFYAFATAKTDENDPMVAAFLDVLVNGAKYPADRQIAIRHAFAVRQQAAVQPLAGAATDPALRAALQTYADGWADLAAVRSAAGPGRVQPDWQPVLDLCPGVQDRISADLEARGR